MEYMLGGLGWSEIDALRDDGLRAAGREKGGAAYRVGVLGWPDVAARAVRAQRITDGTPGSDRRRGQLRTRVGARRTLAIALLAIAARLGATHIHPQEIPPSVGHPTPDLSLG